MCQVGYLPELYKDARSEKIKFRNWLIRLRKIILSSIKKTKRMDALWGKIQGFLMSHGMIK